MVKIKERVVILCVLFEFNQFVAFRCYNIDREIVQDIFHNDLYMFKIWGMKKEAEKYLYRNKRLKNIPKIPFSDNYRVSEDFIGYRNLPIIDNGSYFSINTLNRVIVYTYKEKGQLIYRTVSSYGNIEDFISVRLLNILRNSNFICNITFDSTKIVPLNTKFYTKSFIDNKIKGKGENKYKLLENKFEFRLKEKRNEYRRKLGLIVDDAVKNSAKSKSDIREKESRDLVIKGMLGSSDAIYSVLKSRGLGHIFKNKKELSQVNTFLDTEKLLDELNKINNSPCGDSDCTSVIKQAKSNSQWSSYSANQKSVSNTFLSNKGKILKKQECNDCFTMQNIMGMSYMTNNDVVGLFNLGIQDKTFIDVTNRDIFYYNTFRVMLHEYMHYLAYSNIKRNSGICKNGLNSNAYNNLNEGITELLACFFCCGILSNIKGSVKLKYSNSKFMDKSEYKKYINPFLKSFVTFENLVYQENFENQDSIICSYKYLVYLIIHIMKKVGIKEVFDCYFEVDNEKFEKLCKEKIGESKWLVFLNLLDNFDSNSKSVDKQYNRMKKILLK